ncbi:MAG: class I SAM-dependent methyltransferase [Planctomycetota bacterium]
MDAKAYEQFLVLERTHWWFRGRRAVYFGLLEHHLAGDRLESVLDLGCGMGGFLDGLSKVGEAVYPCDIDLESLAHCADRGYRNGVVSSGYRLPYRDASFDLVCMFDAIEHIEDDARAMSEVARVLKPGGRILVSVPAYQFLYANNDRIAQHYRRYTRGSLRRLFEGAGLVVERSTHTNVFLFPLILPAVLALKTFERLFAKEADPKHTNLSWPIPGPLHDVLHDLLYRVFRAELPLTRHFDWPVGHSIAAIAEKPANA